MQSDNKHGCARIKVMLAYIIIDNASKDPKTDLARAGVGLFPPKFFEIFKKNR